MPKKLLQLILLFLIIHLNGLAQQWNGYTYYSNTNSTTGYLIDTNSVNIKTYTFNVGTGYSTHFMPGGDFVRSCRYPSNVLTGGGMTGQLQKLDYNGNLLWSWVYSSATYCLHHDHCILPNGNILVICYDVRDANHLANVGSTSTLTSMQSEKIMELKPIGSNSVEVVWEWKVWDHLVQNVTPTLSTYQSSIVNHPELFNINYQPKKDWLHMNGIDYNPILDQIAFSSHNLNEWYIIDHSTTTAEAAGHSGGNAGKGGDLLYRWGNPAAYQASGTTILNVTHDAHWIPEGISNAGNISGVNNKGVTSPSNKTCADEIVPPRSNYNYTINLGSAFSPSTYVYRHQSSGYTSNMGSVEEYPNGNRMICLATVGSIYEIDAAGNTLWTKSTLGSCPQAHRYTTCYLTNPAPAQPSISLVGNDLQSTTGVTYQWYLNGNLISGATNQLYTPAQAGIYVVRTTDVNGCVYVYSPGFQYGAPIGIAEQKIDDLIQIYPNPTSGEIFIETELKEFEYKLISITGALIQSGKNEGSVNLTTYESGLYFLHIISNVKGSFVKMISVTK
ncbi:MAG: aryl-sulfate sulfotransferase [Sphingobacteriaceae bacterium]|nr:aryl-sulfate sulfotransferase [Sphingobacteriaceae bacterium]